MGKHNNNGFGRSTVKVIIHLLLTILLIYIIGSILFWMANTLTVPEILIWTIAVFLSVGWIISTLCLSKKIPEWVDF